MPSLCSPSTAQRPVVSDAALEEAAGWYARLRDGRADARQVQRWQQWLQAHAEHQLAWQEVEAVSGRFAPLRELPGDGQAAEQLRMAPARIATRLSRRKLLLSVAMLGGAGVFGWAVWRRDTVPASVLAMLADQRTDIGERREIRLDDGGHLWLNTASAVDLQYGDMLRRVVLRRGEVFVNTAADSHGRPFVVDSPHGRMRALGTRFGVRLLDGATTVSVIEGAVAVDTVGGGHATLQAGQAVRFDDASMGAVRTADINAQAWVKGVLVAQDLPLGEVVAVLRRHRHGQIVLAPGLASLQVYGTFPLDDTDRALTMLAQVLNLRLRRSASGQIDVTPA